MVKKVIISLVLFSVLLANQTFAHTGLESSTPRDGETIKEPLQQLSLNFATKIEQTSVIEVTNSNGDTVKLGNFVIEDKEIWATFLQPLANDSYKVMWKIVGKDGHPIEGEFSFTVDAPIEETVENTNEADKALKEEKITNETKEDNTQTEQNLPTYLIPSVVVVLSLVGIGFLWWLLRRK